jgi:polyisoprenoid-binding protein YceI
MRQGLASFVLLLVFTALPALAVPRSYALQAEASTVAFAWDFGEDEIRGNMPVARADLQIDFQAVANSKVNVDVDVTEAEAGFPFASQAMKGPKVLDAKNYPQIHFVSTAVRKTDSGAAIDGMITVRGVTRPMTFDARIYRQAGTDPNDLSQLTILLTGALNRSEFGANGWSTLAGDQVRLQITANIRQAG